MSGVELKELLAAAEAAGDLRCEEALRLVKHAEKVLLEIARVAERSNTSAEIEIDVDEWENTTQQLLSVRPLGKGVWAVLLEDRYSNKEYCIVATRTEGIALSSVPRKVWVAIAKNIVTLAQALKINAVKAARETREAADLAERLASAL